MIPVSAYFRKKGFILAATFTTYMFTLLYVFHAIEDGRYNTIIQFDYASSTGFPSASSIISNSSRQSQLEIHIRNISRTQRVNFLQSKQQYILSLKLNIKHIPRKDSADQNIKHILRNESSYRNNSTAGSLDKITYFRSRLLDSEVKRLRRTVEVFDNVMTKNGVDYMMYGGTLIGSYRHHGLVPWDDDVDVLVPVSAKSVLYHAIKDFDSDYILNHDWVFCWKFFTVNADPIRGYNWRWPYVDIFFYDQNETHIWDIAPKYNQNFIYAKNTVFPLKRRPFMDLQLLAPFNPRAVIDITYDISLCKSGNWIHKWERYGFETSVPCYELYFKFPFVQRTFQNGSCKESLIQNGRTISYFVNVDVRC